MEKINNNIDRIAPLKPIKTDRGKYLVIDFETVEFEGVLIPYAVGIYGDKHFKIIHIAQYIKCDELNDYPYLSKLMTMDIIKYLLSLYNKNKMYVYAHNLGSFDGYIILKALIEMVEINDIKYIIDDTDKIIELKYRNLIFRDSYRIFPASLAKLGEICELELGKLEFNYDISINDVLTPDHQVLVTTYLTNDLIMLYKIIDKFKTSVLNDFNVPLYKIYSTSNLAFRVFRTKFLSTDKNLYSSSIHEYNLIKPSYFGGAVELFKKHGKNLYYYDVNSLYPHVMLKPMPIKYITTIKPSLVEFLNQDMFGFVDCIINLPVNHIKPQVPVRNKDGITYPTGTINGRYFSEEVKSWIKLGYDVEISKVYIFTKELDLFKNYIEYFYALKSDKTIENKRFLNKLMLNGLYGYFGRQIKYDNTSIMKLEDILQITDNIKNLVNLNDNVVYVKFEPKDLKGYNNDTIWSAIDNITIQNNKANVAISAAVTSYARIYMQKFKLMSDNECYYSDTDSLILEKELKQGVGEYIGDFKLEYKIKEGVFIRPKLYGFITDDNIQIIKAAGFPKDSINYEDLNNMLHDSSYVKAINTFNIIKSMTGLNLRGSRLIKMLRIK